MRLVEAPPGHAAAERQGCDRLVVDLAATIRVDSAGLSTLVLVRERASELRRTVCLRGASEELRFLLVLIRMEDRFEFEPAAT